MTVDPSFALGDEEGRKYRTHGFVTLRRFLAPDLVDHVRTCIGGQMRPLGEQQSGFESLGYDILEQDPGLWGLLRDPTFGQVLCALAGRALIYTQGLGFAIRKNKHHGLPWHIGIQSFGYIRSADYGCSLWIPLAPVDPDGQGGGMSVVSEQLLSGAFMFDQVDPLIDRTLQAIARADGDGPRSLPLETFIQLRHGILNNPSMTLLAEAHRTADRFELGDALLFNKRVIHRSDRLSDGPLEARAAFVMRFVDREARYDAERAHALEFQRDYYGIAPQSDFHLQVGHTDGALIRDSERFDSDPARILGVGRQRTELVS